MKHFLASVVLLCIFYSCKNSSDYKVYLHDPVLYSYTVHEFSNVLINNNTPPMIASRDYAYSAIASYEAIAAGFPEKYYSLAGQLNDLQAMPKPDTTQPIDYYLAALLSYIKVAEAVAYPEGSMHAYTDSIMKIARAKGLPSDVEKASRRFADSIADAVLRWSNGDDYARTRGAEKYTVIDTPGRGVPTPPMYGQAIEPHWKEIRPMALDSANQYKWPIPYPFDIKNTSSPYYEQVMQVKNLGDTLTDEQAWIADFWDDNPFKLNVAGHLMFATKQNSPSGHWMTIVGIAAQKAGFNFDETVQAYTQTGIAFFDAFVACWWAKYVYNTVRPETVINKYIAPDWRPRLQTPAFPEYTCGHCTISAAAAETLTNTFGDNFSYTDTSELQFGIKSRAFTSFRQAAEETRLSRVYGGIHFFYSTERGRNVGKQIGEHVVQKLKMKKEEQ
ncbi:MAG: vanadium-dependent haloperoxidase [Chitinophagaceae bacterium]|nr:vanadium-dependent haloperoxidase [Chitinophagaceae bacterium]